jgi:hypothetical protein
LPSLLSRLTSFSLLQRRRRVQKPLPDSPS